MHALGASGLGYAMARRGPEGRAPFVFNPQGLEEFGGTHPGFARLKRLAYTPLQAAVRRCAQAADAILATDHALVAPVRTHLAVDPARVHVVPNAVDLETIDRARASAAATAATLRTRLGLAAGERLLLSVGRLEENKGFHVLAAALAELRARAGGGAGWRWVLVGDGPYRPRIAGAIDAAGLASHVHLAGRVAESELAGWYAAADVFVHPTLYEGSSLVTLEAMAHGKPVVATRAGGLPDKVRPGETGWLVEPGAASALAGALAESLGRASRHAGALRRSRAAAGRGGVRLAGGGGAARSALRRAAAADRTRTPSALPAVPSGSGAPRRHDRRRAPSPPGSTTISSRRGSAFMRLQRVDDMAPVAVRRGGRDRSVRPSNRTSTSRDAAPGRRSIERQLGRLARHRDHGARAGPLEVLTVGVEHRRGQALAGAGDLAIAVLVGQPPGHDVGVDHVRRQPRRQQRGDDPQPAARPIGRAERASSAAASPHPANTVSCSAAT